MSIRNVLGLIAIICVVSGATAFFTVRFLTSETKPSAFEIQSANGSAGQPSFAPPTDVAITPTPPIDLAPKKGAQTKNTLTSSQQDFSLPQPSLDEPNVKDTRKPMSSSEAKQKILKDVPACHEEYDKLCRGSIEYSEQPLACLRKYKDQINSACHSQLRALRDEFLQACNEDIKKLCASETRYFHCLKKRAKQLSVNCRIKIEQQSRN